jgi:hypothetical protein
MTTPAEIAQFIHLPGWSHAHRVLDEVVAAAYGWPADLSDDAIRYRASSWELSPVFNEFPSPEPAVPAHTSRDCD